MQFTVMRARPDPSSLSEGAGLQTMEVRHDLLISVPFRVLLCTYRK